MNKLKRSMTTLLASASVIATSSFAQNPAPAAPAPQDAPAPAAAPVSEPAPAVEPAPANEPPQVGGIPGESILEGGTFSKIKLDNFVSDDSDQPSQIRWKVSGNKNLKVSISPDHTVEIATPNPLWNGSEDLTFTATDSKGASASETVNFTVESVNNPPVVSQIPSQVITEGKQFAKIRLDDFVNDPDHKKDQISWDTEVIPAGGPQADGDLSVTIDGNRVATVIVPDAHWYGAATIKFIANDPDYGSDNKTAAFTVTPVNDPPAFTKKIPDQVIDEKNQFDMISLADYVTDPDDDVMKLKWSVTGNKDLKIEIDNYGSAIVTIPNEYWNGQERVTFTVTDAAGASAKQDVLFKVNSINDAPEFVQNIPDQTIDEKQEFAPIQLGQYVKDPDHRIEMLKWAVSGAKDLKVSVSGGVATIRIPNKLWNGSESIKFKATDPEGASADCEAMFTVNSVNDLPKFIRPIPAQNINEKQQFTKIKLDDFVKDEDHKNSELSWDVEVKHQGPMPEMGTLNVTIDDQHVATVEIPDPSWNGNTVATFTVTDPEGGSAKQDVALNVRSVNDPPVFKKIPDQAIEEKNEFTSFILDDYLSDADHDFSKLKVEVTGNRDLKVNIDNRSHEVSVKIPHDQWNGTETLMFTATDPEGARASTSAKFTVKAINDPPVMKDIREQTIKEKGEFQPIELDNFVEDLDHAKNRLKWTITGNKELKVAMDAAHVARITPPSPQWHGAEALMFKVCDPDNACDERTANFTVESVNDVPMFVKQVMPQTIREKGQFQPIKLADLVKDLDNKLSELTFSVSSKPAAGSKKRDSELKVEIDDQKVAKIVIPNKFWNGAEEITFTVTDPEGAKASSSALFTVESVNDLPEIKQVVDQTIQEKGEFTPFNVSELVSDPDDRFESLKIDFTGNKDLKVDMSKAGVVTVKTPNKMWNGSEKVTFTVTDPSGAKARTTATFTVVSVNDPPVMKEIASQTVKEKESFKPIELDNYVEDLDHAKNRLKWKIEGNKDLRVTMDATHKVTVTPPNASWNGSEKIRFTVTDPDGASDSKEVTFTVLSVNDAPEFVRDLRDQSIDEKKQFQPIKLADFVKDADHKISDLKWTFKVSPIGQASSKKKGKKDDEEPAGEMLRVNVDANQVANIVIPNKYWHGAANITFTATDPEGASASKTARFEVRSVNDAPVIAANAPTGETILEGGRFKTIDLSTLAEDPDHPASSLKWEVSGNRDLKVDIRKDNTVIISVPDKQWSGKENLTFSVTDPEGAYARHKMLFEVTRVNDPPTFVKRIPDQKIKEKETFKQIKLDEFVKDPDNKPNELRWRITGAKQLKAEISASRVLTVTAPNKDFWCTPELMMLEVSDPDGAKTSQTISFEIVSVNDPPVLRDIPPQKIREKGQFKDIDLSKFVRDPDNSMEQLSWAVKVQKPESEQAKKSKKGKKGKKDDDDEEEEVVKDAFSVVIYKGGLAHINIADKYWHGERNVVFTVKDPDGATDSKTVNFAVESVNDAPVIRPILAQTIKEKEHFEPIDLTKFVSDPDHPTSSLKFEIAPTRALKATINAKKQLVVTTPDKYWNGSEKIRLDVTDPEGARASQQIDFEVTPVNDPPVITKEIGNQKIKEKERFTPVDLAKIVNDPDNKPNELKWTVSGNKDLVVDIKNGRASVTTPNPNWFGKETLTFTVMDPAGDKQSTKATFEVIPVNDPPKFKPIPPQVIDEKKTFPAIDLTKFVTDPDNSVDELKWSIDGENPFAAAPAKSKKKDKKKDKKKKKHVEEEPAPKFGKHELKYNISDKGILTVEIPNKYWNGSETVTINVFDPSKEKASTEVRFTVKSVNDVPVVKEIPGQTTLEGKAFKPINLDDFVSDPDHKNSEIRWKVTGAKNLDVRINANRVAEIKPRRDNWFGDETLVFTATDPAGGTDKSVVKFVVKHVNAAPVMRDIPDYTIRENQNEGVIATIKLDQYARDKDHNFDDLKWKFTGQKQLQVTYDKAKKTVIVAQPYSHWKGKPERITFTVTDPEGATAHKTATFTVIAVNNAPETKPLSYQTREGETLKVPASTGLMSAAKDPDGDKLESVKTVMKPRNGRIVLNEKNGSFEYTPNKGFSGIDEFTYKVFDPSGLGSKVTNVEINVQFKPKDVRGNSANKKKK
ncbi:tandem-95 repeat protein [Fibrobacter succinogenes]|uniref:tandem-95 repeat protein n=1 Tax=Fibrobacter succinogenes TaxID=833 RepID=UPI00156A5610|nr:tandem-95 repeat protein [Fibrobacter succinogenes]